MTAQNDAPRRQIAEFCRRWQISEFAFIGRARRGAADSRGGFDVLVRYAPEAKHTLFCEVEMERELADIFGCDVGLVGREAIEQSSNPIRRAAALQAAECLYAA